MSKIFDLFNSQKFHSDFESQLGKITDIASIFNKGFLISKWCKMTRKDSFTHLLLLGPPGSGKTTYILSKQLLSIKNASFVINDPSGELYLMLGGYLSETHEIERLNFSDSNQSAGFNILARIKKSSDINKLAFQLVQTTLGTGNQDPFWSLQAQNLIKVLLQLTLLSQKENQNIAYTLYLLKLFNTDIKQVDKLIVETGNVDLILDYKAIIAIPEKTLFNIAASASSALEFLNNEDIKNVVSRDSINFEELRQKPTIIFLQNSVADMKYCNTLNGIFFQQLFQFILSKLPSKKELDLFLIIDEASSLYIELLPLALANCRKHRVGSLLCIQTIEQLKSMYGKESANVINNCNTKIYLSGINSLETLRDLETLSGKHISMDKNGQQRVKPLLSIEAIRCMPRNKCIVASGNNKLIISSISPIFKSWRFKRRINLQIPESVENKYKLYNEDSK